jgi:hypothetical protein
MSHQEQKTQNDGWQIIIGVSCGLLLGCILVLLLYKGAFRCKDN